MSYHTYRVVRNSIPQASRPIPVPTPIRKAPSETPVAFPDESTDSSSLSDTEEGLFPEARSPLTGTPDEMLSSEAVLTSTSAAIDIPPPNVAGRCRLSLNDYSPPVESSSGRHAALASPTSGSPGSLDSKTTAMRNPREAQRGASEDSDLQFELEMHGDRPG